MRFQFLQVKYKGILELEGEINFPKDKVVIITGKNQQGKTDCIETIRFALLKRKKRGGSKLTKELPKVEQLIWGGNPSVEIVFEHYGERYKLCMELQKDKIARIYNSKSEPIPNASTFLDKDLKASIIATLFAREVRSGFEKLEKGEIGKAIREIFHDIMLVRDFSKEFINRLEIMKERSEAYKKDIENNYEHFLKEILERCPSIGDFKAFKILREKFEPYETPERVKKLTDDIRKKIEMLEKEKTLESLINYQKIATALERLRTKLNKSEIDKIKKYLVEIKNNNEDKKQLNEWKDKLPKTIEGSIEAPPTFHSIKLNEMAREIYSKLEKAKRLYEDAKSKVSETEFKNIEEKMEEIKNLLSVKEFKNLKRISGGVTKIGKIAHAVIPFKLLKEDPDFARFSELPYVEGFPSEYKKYCEAKLKILEDVDKRKKESESIFSEFQKADLEKLNNFAEILDKKKEEINKIIENWGNEFYENYIANVEKVRFRPIKNEKDLVYIMGYSDKIDKKEKECLEELNKIREVLQLPRVDIFTKKVIEDTIDYVKSEKKLGLQNYYDAVDEIDKWNWKGIKDWGKIIEKYSEYSKVPKMVEEIISIFKIILEKSMDERTLIEKIKDNYHFMIKFFEKKGATSTSCKLVGEMKAQLSYKGRETISRLIGGSEWVFYSLAILTALGFHFGIPIIMDECGNNLDKDNLKNFFDSVLAFKNEKRFREHGRVLQYILILLDKDYELLQPWIKKHAEDVVVYEVKDKKIYEKIIT